MKTVLFVFAAASFLVPARLWAQEPPSPQNPPAPAEDKPAPQISPQRQQQLERLFQQLQKAYEDKDFQQMNRLLQRDARRQQMPARPNRPEPFAQAPRRQQNRFLAPQAGPRQNRWARQGQFAPRYGRFRQEQGRAVRPMDAPRRWAYQGRPWAGPQGPRWFRQNAPSRSPSRSPFRSPSRPRWNQDFSGWNRPGRFFPQGPAPDFWAD